MIAFASEQVRASRIVPDPIEVAFSEWARVSDLMETRIDEERVVRGVPMRLPEFQWKNERMWGMTALIFDLILKRYVRMNS